MGEYERSKNACLLEPVKLLAAFDHAKGMTVLAMVAVLSRPGGTEPLPG
jgi:hypothetical protein